MKRVLFMFLASFAFGVCSAQITCRIEGEVINRIQSTQLKIHQSLKDPRFDGEIVEIKDGKFSFELTGDEPLIYEIVFMDELKTGAWRPYKFCSVDGTVKITLHDSGNFKNNRIQSAVQDTYSQIRDSLVTQMTSGLTKVPREKQLTPKTMEFRDKINNMDTGKQRDSLLAIWNQLLSSGDAFSDEYKEYRSAAYSIQKDIEALMDIYEVQNPSIFSYVNLVHDLQSLGMNHDLRCTAEYYINKFTSIYEKRYPEHVYTKMCREHINSLNSIKVGGRFIDFVAPDLQGRTYKLSELIKGKYALIDLWASWCGPCRRSSISYKPLWEEFAGNQFTIVGVAGEFKNDEAMRKAIEQDGYEWINLIELDRKADIWAKYGASNSGGRVIMVDSEGVIVAVSPTVEQVREILEKAKIKK